MDNRIESLSYLILPAVLLLVPTLHPPRESAIVLRAGTGGAGRALPLGDAVRDSLALCGLLLVSTQASLTPGQQYEIIIM